MENEHKKHKLWAYLIPVYIVVCILIIMWVMKNYSTDVKLSDDTLKAFSTTANIKTDENYKFYEPNLSDLTYSVNYKNAGEESDRQSSGRKTVYALEHDKTEEKKGDVVQRKEPVNNQNVSGQMKDIKGKEMSAVGYKKGFLTDAVGKLLNNPKAVASLFNNEFVVKGFLSRDLVKQNLSDSHALESFLSNPKTISNFLNNPVVSASLNNPALLNSLAGTKMMQEIMTSKAVTDIMSDPSRMNNILMNNPGLNKVLANPNVISALSHNPGGAKILSLLGGSGNK
jgi:hypothetical protein